MEAYLDTLTREFRDNYKPLSDKQRSYEERTKVALKRFAEGEGGEDAPQFPAFVWSSLVLLEGLSDFVGEAKSYRAHFETPLDDASELLRDELARILGRRRAQVPRGGAPVT
jgi:hypothetical protein